MADVLVVDFEEWEFVECDVVVGWVEYREHCFGWVWYEVVVVKVVDEVG